MKRLLSATAMVSIAAVSAPAWAQSSDGLQGSGLGDIVVTAQKRSENIQDVPIAISAVGTAYLESRGIDSIEKLGTIAPNVKIDRGASNKTISQIAIRGSVTNNPAITWEPAVGIYIDGVYIAKGQGSFMDLADLERVEILRGPQGTLYGRNALAGALSLVSKKPSGEAGGSAEISYGNFNEFKARAVIDLPQMGIFSAKFSGQYRKQDGFYDVVPNKVEGALGAMPPQVKDTDNVNTLSFMAQVRAEVSENVTVDYVFDYNNADLRPPSQQLYRVNKNGDPRDIFDPNSANYAGPYFPLDKYISIGRDRELSIDSDVYEKSKTFGHAVTVTADLGAATLKSITAYRDLKWDDSIDIDGSPLPLVNTKRDTDYHAFSQELQLTGQAINDRLSYVVGAFYFKEKAETDNPQSFFGGSLRMSSNMGSHTEAYALYSQLDYKLTDALKVSLGARYTHEKKDIRRFFSIDYDAANNILEPFTMIDVGYGDVPDATFENFSPAVTVAYEISPTVNVYGRFARGFKSGGFNGETAIAFDPTAPADCPYGATELCDPYDAETVDSYELGLKTRLLDNRLIFNVAAFNDIHKDIQLSIFRANRGTESIVRNAAKARIRGLEFEAVFRPIDILTLNGSLAFLDAKYLNYIDAGVDVSDNRAFMWAPKRTASLAADLRIAEGDWGKFNLYGDLNYLSSFYTFPFALRTSDPSAQNANNTKAPARTVVNLRASISQMKLGGVDSELSFYVRNLFKENKETNFIDFGASFGGLTVANYLDPRTYGVSLGVKF
jgi:iron complex outermembrane receptor protein